MIREVKRKEVPLSPGFDDTTALTGNSILEDRLTKGTMLSNDNMLPGIEPDLLGRIVVTAGIFLLLFLTGRLLHEPTQETVCAWVSSNEAYETVVEVAAVWVEEQVKGGEEPISDGKTKE